MIGPAPGVRPGETSTGCVTIHGTQAHGGRDVTPFAEIVLEG